MKRQNAAFNAQLAARWDAIRHDVEHLTIIINEDGSVAMIDSPAAREIAAALGTSVVNRASHVEPCNRILRTLFHFIRTRVSDESRLAAWTRRWRCDWQITLSDAFGGTTLPERFHDRQAAIAFEIEYVNQKLSQ